MKLDDSDKLSAGKIWKRSNDVHEALVEAFSVLLEAWPDLVKILDLFMAAWGKYHHPTLSAAYILNPEYHRSKSWLDPTVKEDVEAVLWKQFLGSEERGKIKAALTRYQNHKGCFDKLDAEGEKRAIWADTFMTEVAPWAWWQDVAQAEDPELFRFAWRTLRVGVASSCNERVSSRLETYDR